ncbi:MAG: extracellular solute-binding protein [Lachnospiraceae bacterium]|nr:extracellular solute-binding protein [Lachnospiraceae bacterium]MCI7596928.1 extracellular solute-binding protein [Lachnospiraceae bacterium]MDY3221606.1 extracellular solute-binding protein [Lachnospiraceae bacterium]
MKKLLALLLVGAMSLSLVACGGNTNQTVAEDTSVAAPSEAESEAASTDSAAVEDIAADITLWTYPVGNWGDAASVEALIAGFNEVYPNINVTVELLDYTNGDDQVNTAIEGGQAPDLIFEGPERLVANWGAKGLLVDLTDIWSTDVSASIYDAIESACKGTDGKYYEYPVCMTAHTMAINYDLFKAADALQYIDEETHTWTTEDFQKAVEAVVAYGHDNVGAVFCAGQGGDQGTRALVNNLYGGTFTNAAHTEYTANSAENVKALELLKSMKGINFDPSIVGGDEIALFCNGTLGMAFCWNVAQEKANADAVDFDIFPMAFPSDGTPKLQGGIWGFGVFDNGDANRIDASKAFIKYITQTDDVYSEAVKTSTYWPVRDVAGIYDGDDLMTEYGMFMQYMGDYYQVTAGWAEARTAWWNMLQKVGAGTDVTTAVEEFVTTANAAATAAQ